MTSTVNISGYKFIPLEKIATLRVDLRKKALELGIKGTILLSHEGININLAAGRKKIDSFKLFLSSDPRFADIVFKESISEFVPFEKMLVKLKKEIISMGIEGIQPPSQPENALSPKELKEWYDKGKPFTILDTRNYYEAKIGTFKNAKVLPLDNFRQFPKYMENFSEEEKEHEIVMFCTGGVRCEKAMPYLQKLGLKNIFQLHGGIIKYFEECGGEHYEGECFVFDDRIALNPDLTVSGAVLCSGCQAPVTTSEQTEANFGETLLCLECQKPGFCKEMVL